MQDQLTIAIIAKDAAATIKRAIASALAEKDCPIILVDDHCTDNTVKLAQQLAGNRLSVYHLEQQTGVGAARQRGLESITTPYAAWLDADDEWIAGRASRILEALEAGADVYSDPIELYNGQDGSFTCELGIPDFIRNDPTPIRLFERNHLPCDTQVGFRVATFREAGGYDPEIIGPESFDMLLRALTKAAAKFSYGTQPGYKMYAYPNSVSRNLPRQRKMLEKALRKHNFEDVQTQALCAGYGERITAWILISMAFYRNQPDMALRFVEQACPSDADTHEILEPNGPFPFYEGWRREFARGTARLLMNTQTPEAIAALEKANKIESTPETLNNLGVAYRRDDRGNDATQAFQNALALKSAYRDASLNLEDANAQQITTHPMRRAASRDDYKTSQKATAEA